MPNLSYAILELNSTGLSNYLWLFLDVGRCPLGAPSSIQSKEIRYQGEYLGYSSIAR